MSWANLAFETNPGLVAVGIIAVAILLFVIYLSKEENENDWAYLIINAAVFVVGVAALGAVLGHWDIPYIDYFNDVWDPSFIV